MILSVRYGLAHLLCKGVSALVVVAPLKPRRRAGLSSQRQVVCALFAFVLIIVAGAKLGPTPRHVPPFPGGKPETFSTAGAKEARQPDTRAVQTIWELGSSES